MEPLGTILKRIGTKRREMSEMLNDVPPNVEPQPTVEACPRCNGAGWLSRKVKVGHPDFGQIVLCACRKEAWDSQKRERLEEYARLPASIPPKTFDNLNQVPG